MKEFAIANAGAQRGGKGAEVYYASGTAAVVFATSMASITRIALTAACLIWARQVCGS